MANEPINTDSETWKPVPSLPGVFASTLGRIWIAPRIVPSNRAGQAVQTRPAQIVSGEIGGHSYHMIKLRREGATRKYFVHRLVCEAFNGPPKDGDTVDHLDGCRLNNTPDNLEWVSRAENSRRQNADGRGAPKGEAHPTAKLTNFQAESVRRLRQEGWRVADISKLFGVSASLIYGIMQGRKRPHTQPPAISAASNRMA